MLCKYKIFPCLVPFTFSTLFFSPKEEEILITLQQKFSPPLEEELTPQDTLTLHLKAIFYTAPDQWRVWINEWCLNPKESLPNLRISHVTPYEVRCTWHLQDQIYHVTLKVGQKWGPSKMELEQKAEKTYVSPDVD